MILVIASEIEPGVPLHPYTVTSQTQHAPLSWSDQDPGKGFY